MVLVMSWERFGGFTASLLGPCFTLFFGALRQLVFK